MAFQLHHRLQQDCLIVGSFELNLVLMMNDSQWPWFILVPQRDGINEIYQLDELERGLLIEESCLFAEQLAVLFDADKMNIAAIGNLVPQLHIHHIVRYRGDKAWPGTVWANHQPVPYSEQQKQEAINRVRGCLTGILKNIV